MFSADKDHVTRIFNTGLIISHFSMPRLIMFGPLDEKKNATNGTFLRSIYPSTKAKLVVGRI